MWESQPKRAAGSASLRSAVAPGYQPGATTSGALILSRTAEWEITPLSSVRSRSRSNEVERQPERLPLRWAVIMAVAGAASVPAAAVGGLPAAIGTFIMVAGALHVMIA